MVFRQCPKCKVIFNRKSTYDYHMNRKTECSLNNNSNDLDDDISQNFTINHKITQNFTKKHKISQNYTELNLNLNSNYKNDEIFAKKLNNSNILKTNLDDSTKTNDFSNIDETTFCCTFCDKKFVNKFSLLRHINESCKVKKSIDKEKENIFKLLLEKDKQKDNEINELKKQKEMEINELKKQNQLFEKQNKMLMDKIDKLINIKENSKPSKIINDNKNITNNLSNTNNNIQNNNFVMVNFGKEDLSIIDEKQFIDRVVKKPLLSGVKIPDEVLKIIHFNPKYPQLSNIYISDINREKCMVYEDGEWKLSSIDNIPQIIDKVCIFSSEQINLLRTKYPNNKQLNDRLNILEKYNNLIDGDYLEDLRDDNLDGSNLNQIARCEEFQKYTYDTIKKTLYNEGKKIKKSIK
jgi:uncharacterized C2H2 Zn-finger protein